MGTRGPKPELDKDAQVLALRMERDKNGERLTFDEIAKRLGVSKPAVWNRYKRAIKELNSTSNEKGKKTS